MREPSSSTTSSISRSRWTTSSRRLRRKSRRQRWKKKRLADTLATSLFQHEGTKRSTKTRKGFSPFRVFVLLFVPCMFKTRSNDSTAARRVRMARSAATSHADTANRPRPIVPRPSTAVTKQGPDASCVKSSEQSTELLRHKPPARSHSQDRNQRMDTADTSVSPASVPLTVPPAPAAPTQPLVIGVDMAKDKFDLAFSDGRPQQTLSNDSAGIEQAIRLLNKAD